MTEARGVAEPDDFDTAFLATTPIHNTLDSLERS